MTAGKNWKQRIDNAEQNGYFDDSDRNDSVSWYTCAVGEVVNRRYPARIRRYGDMYCYYLLDDVYEMGSGFTGAVQDNDILRARRLQYQIRVTRKFF